VPPLEAGPIPVPIEVPAPRVRTVDTESIRATLAAVGVDAPHDDLVALALARSSAVGGIASLHDVDVTAPADVFVANFAQDTRTIS
jgi:hypothetical protein